MNFVIWLFKDVLYLGATASLLIVLLLAVKRLFRRGLSPKWQYYIWALLLIRLLVPFQVQSPMSVYSLIYGAASSINLPMPETVGALQNPLINETAPPAPTGGTADVNAQPGSLSGQTPAEGGGTPSQGAETAGDVPVIKIAALLWLSGVSLLVLYTAVVNIAFAGNVRRRYRPLRDKRIDRILESCRAALNIRRRIPLLTSGEKRTPSLYGLLRPKILVSGTYLSTLGDDEVRYIFLHELSHFKRGDIAVNWLLTALQAVYFFNPLVWYAFHKIHEDCEISCDAEVLKYLRPEERLLYGGTILKLVRLLSESNFVPVTAGISKNKSSTKRRLTMISNFKRSKWTGTVLAILLIAVVGLAGLTGCSTNTGAPAPSPSSDSAGTPSESPSAPPSPSADGTGADVSPESPSAPTSAAPAPTDGPGNVAPSTAPAPTAGLEPSIRPVPAAAQKAYYGEWTVKSVLAYGIGTYSKDDAEKLVGKSVSFSSDKASYYNDTPSAGVVTASDPDYTESTLSAEDFMTSYRMTFDKLGITADSVDAVDVGGPQGAGGCTLLVKDKNTVILAAGGTYFELSRAS
ncbi:Signal transducer regulating beta-lactamase production, contains metallopeptidase domain [Sporobacter termitidis DSM 10068]|uniref:Signal transducer regulating beta-lactamase production, contains metallopeptidase domain n=1 Tax=Sporobacter termitidis DSM 10068 TaxID=1123282 RepID=A0A1M5YWD5_9FIRM|nr:M56 family metallopeptidase [Sporobacter termitidis]SHI16377.1 Signal transducer regulating beta-lactamase production, contains metallopeptidase domain [Sporobacter termitidis DSM 10068]